MMWDVYARYWGCRSWSFVEKTMMDESGQDEGQQIQEKPLMLIVMSIRVILLPSGRYSSNCSNWYPKTGTRKLSPPSCQMVGKIIKHNQTICNRKAIVRNIQLVDGWDRRMGVLLLCLQASPEGLTRSGFKPFNSG